MSGARDNAPEPVEVTAVRRRLTERERDVLLYLLAGDDPTATALRHQVEDALVLQESSCCASIHLMASTSASDAQANGWPLAIEAEVRDRPDLVVRLITSGEARLSQLELVHDDAPEGLDEFPPPQDLDAPEWFELRWSDERGEWEAQPL